MADSDPRALFRYIAAQLNALGLAYLHVIEPRIKGGELIAEGQESVASQELSKIFKGQIIAAGGFEATTAEAIVTKGDASLVAFGRHFIANPDLPKRIELGLTLDSYDRGTFYGFEARGYTDYPIHEANSKIKKLNQVDLKQRTGDACEHSNENPFNQTSRGGIWRHRPHGPLRRCRTVTPWDDANCHRSRCQGAFCSELSRERSLSPPGDY